MDLPEKDSMINGNPIDDVPITADTQGAKQSIEGVTKKLFEKIATYAEAKLASNCLIYLFFLLATEH